MVRVLKGIRDAENWQRGRFLGVMGLRVVLGARKARGISSFGSSGVAEGITAA